MFEYFKFINRLGINDASDRLIRNLLLLSCFLPMGEIASVDAYLSKKGPSTLRSLLSGRPSLSGRSYRIATIASGTLVVQIVCLYWGVSAQRWRLGSSWFASDGSAMFWIMSGCLHTTKVAAFFASFPKAMYWLTLKASATEFSIPTMLLLTDAGCKYRTVLAVVIALFHIGIRLTLVLTNFTLANLITAVMFLPSTFYKKNDDNDDEVENENDGEENENGENGNENEENGNEDGSNGNETSISRKSGSQNSALRHRRKEQEVSSDQEVSDSTDHDVLKPKKVQYVSFTPRKWKSILSGFLGLYMLYHVLAVDFNLIPSWDSGDIGLSIRFTQGKLSCRKSAK